LSVAHGLRALAACALLTLAACGPRGESERSSSAAARSGTQAAPAAAEPARLVGQWMRTDSEYVIAIEKASADGKLAARYLNPQPIHVSKAQWLKSGPRLQLMVEMQDRGYPGSNYELDYDAAHDTLFGTYHHLGINQDFQVSFYRMKPGDGAVR
jgi:hypothetical protein